MFLLYIYILATSVTMSIASIYQGYCDARFIKNRLSEFYNFEDDSTVIVIAACWPLILVILIVGFPFWCMYELSKEYFKK